MTTEESYQECMRKAKSHLQGAPPHIPNALHYAYYAVVRAANLPAAKRHAAMDVLQKAIRAAVGELQGDGRYTRYSVRQMDLPRSEAPFKSVNPAVDMNVLQKVIKGAVRGLAGMYDGTPEDIVAAGVVQHITEDTIQLEKTASTMDHVYIGETITIHHGSGAVTMFVIQGYNGKEQRITKVSPAMMARLDNTSYYVIRTLVFAALGR